MPESNDRLTDLGQFYEILHRLDKTGGGVALPSHRMLGEDAPCASHGVYFLALRGLEKSIRISGVGPRELYAVERLRVDRDIRTTLWNGRCLSTLRRCQDWCCRNHSRFDFPSISAKQLLSKRGPHHLVLNLGLDNQPIAAVRS
jgi:hypothetical protein